MRNPLKNIKHLNYIWFYTKKNKEKKYNKEKMKKNKK